MIKTEQGDSDSSGNISAQSSKQFLATIWRELMDWGAIAINSLGRFLTALLNCAMLAVVAIMAALAVIVLMLREHIMTQSEDSTFSLIGIKSFLGKKQVSVSE